MEINAAAGPGHLIGKRLQAWNWSYLKRLKSEFQPLNPSIRHQRQYPATAIKLNPTIACLTVIREKSKP
jgi:hypothetical protein